MKKNFMCYVSSARVLLWLSTLPFCYWYFDNRSFHFAPSLPAIDTMALNNVIRWLVFHLFFICSVSVTFFKFLRPEYDDTLHPASMPLIVILEVLKNMEPHLNYKSIMTRGDSSCYSSQLWANNDPALKWKYKNTFY